MNFTNIPYTGRSHFDGQNLMESGGKIPYQVKTGWLGRGMKSAGLTGKGLALALPMPLLIRGVPMNNNYYPVGDRLPSKETMSIIEQAFKDHDAFQCGYCTPGQICSATALIEQVKQNWPSYVTTDLKNPNGLLVQEIAERMSGNICRCSAYPNIVDAISQVLESEVSNQRASSSEETTTGSLQDSAVTGIWSPPPSQSQLGNQSVNHNKTASSTAGGRS